MSVPILVILTPPGMGAVKARAKADGVSTWEAWTRIGVETLGGLGGGGR